MIIDNFKLKSITKEGKGVFADDVYMATVDVEKGHLWWKRKKYNVQICKKCVNWFFMNTGVWTPSNIVENLYRSYEANVISKRIKERSK